MSKMTTKPWFTYIMRLCMNGFKEEKKSKFITSHLLFRWEKKKEQKRPKRNHFGMMDCTHWGRTVVRFWARKVWVFTLFFHCQFQRNWCERVVCKCQLSAQSFKMNRFTFYYDIFWQDDNLIYVIMIHNNLCMCVAIWESTRKVAYSFSFSAVLPYTQHSFGQSNY